MLPEPLVGLAKDVLAQCERQGLMLAAAESCTGGLVMACLTAVPGSSSVVDRGFVTYTNEAKIENLGVSKALLAEQGAVSEDVARAMAEGVLRRSRAHIGVAVTGIAGPTGATPEKPVGLVHIAVARKGRTTEHERHVIDGDRDGVRLKAAGIALRMLQRMAGA
ncbi:MAG: CinA family protein [Rhodospirillales bacterium]|nr:CinA family protein [Rhodospirillales bacterium]